MVQITINGKSIRTEAGRSVLEVARESGFVIPTLCHHPGLPPYGACRLCLVEVISGFRPGLTSSCVLPVMDSLEVETASEAVLAGRRLVVELLLARAPDAPEIRALARSLGVGHSDLPVRDADERCILCGRCVRACQALQVDAIAFVYRGIQRRVAVPFDRTSERCLACRACLSVCPTGAISAKIEPEAVEMVEWRTRLAFERCRICKRPYTPERQRVHLRHRIDPQRLAAIDLCPTCRRQQTASSLGALKTLS